VIKANKIFEGDVLDFLRGLPDECADLIIADPPYNLKKDREFGEGAFFDSTADWFDWCKLWLDESKRILKPMGNLFVYGIHHYACFLQVYMYEIGLEYRRQIIWYYENGWSKYRQGPACHYEPILWFAHTQTSTFHVIREPYKSSDRLRHPIKKNGKVWKPNPEGRQGGDVWKFPTLAGRRFANERTVHPTQKPLALSRRIIEHFSNPGDMIIVPFVGSGSECVAAVETNRVFGGSEINKDFAAMARERVSKAAPLIEVSTDQRPS
jgi:DNA modification methylase